MSPSSIVSSPAMARSVVVLPQPDWPSSTMNSLSRDLEVELLDDLDGAEELLDAAKLDLSSMAAVVMVGRKLRRIFEKTMKADQPDER